MDGDGGGRGGGIGHRRDELVETLRHRITAALSAGVLRPGARLASTRALAAELGADPRQIAAAYRVLAADGLVEMRRRSGIYVGGGAPSESWVVDVLAQGIARGVPAHELGERLRLGVANVRLRALAIATTLDQSYGLCRELADDYGLESDAAQAELLFGDGGDGDGRRERALAAAQTADLLVTTEAHAERVGRLAGELGVPHVAISVRDNLVGREWRELLRRSDVYVVAVDPRFCMLLRHYLRPFVDVDGLRSLVAGQDDVRTIPDGAPVYVTQAARQVLGDTPVPGRPLQPARLFSAACSREILTVMVRANAIRDS